jgi:predicted DsbA family dithiol-disulfide isomerase
LRDQIIEKYPSDVRFVIKHFPLPFHKQAKKAALYSLAAERQGKFLEMERMIFENIKELKNNEDLPRQYAEQLGLDMAQFDKDMEDRELETRIIIDMVQMRQSGIPRMSVPKFLINGKEPQGGRSFENYSAIIDAELKKN